MSDIVSANRNSPHSALVAVAAAVIAGAIAWMSMAPSGMAKDFTLPWTAATHLLAGRDPYAAMVPTGVYPFNVPFYYPFPAAVLAMPFALLPATVAGIAFVSLSFGIAAWVLAREGEGRVPLLLGFPAVMAAALGQWSPLLLAATVAPVLQIVMPVKPTLGAAVFVNRPSRLGLAAALALVALSFLIFPGWVPAWRAAVSSAWATYTPPVLWVRPLGVVLLIAAMWWRGDRDARLLALLAVVPQLPLFYDQLLAHAVARTRRECWALVIAGWIGGLAWALQGTPTTGERPAREILLATVYLPAFAVIVWRNRRVARSA